MNFSDRGIRQLAVSLALVFFAIAKYYEPQLPDWVDLVMPGAAPQTTTHASQVLAAAWSGIKVGILILVFEHVLYRIVARAFVGRWAYVSSSGNLAIADIEPRGFWAGGIGLSYRVSLFQTASEVEAALSGEPAGTPFGTAEGFLVGFKDDKMTVVYQVSVGSAPYDARKGILTLSLTANENVLSGVWESTKVNTTSPTDDKKVRTGDLKFYRPSAFLKAVKAGEFGKLE